MDKLTHERAVALGLADEPWEDLTDYGQIQPDAVDFDLAATGEGLEEGYPEPEPEYSDTCTEPESECPTIDSGLPRFGAQDPGEVSHFGTTESVRKFGEKEARFYSRDFGRGAVLWEKGPVYLAWPLFALKGRSLEKVLAA